MGSCWTDRQLKPAVPGGEEAGKTAVFWHVEMSAQWRFAVSVGGFWLCSARLDKQKSPKKSSGVSRLVRVWGWGTHKKRRQKNEPPRPPEARRGRSAPFDWHPPFIFSRLRTPPIRPPEIELVLAAGRSVGVGAFAPTYRPPRTGTGTGARPAARGGGCQRSNKN